MKISQVSGASHPFSGMDGQDAATAPAAQDVSWFSAAISPGAAANQPEKGNAVWIDALAGRSGHLDGLRQKAERQVGKSLHSNNPKDVMDATRTLSSFYLESLLNAKVVAKSVQSLEKLTNLQ
ncbi:serine kinase [Lonsdalea populi]|uniref:Serine kinase n=1 Tax=Lonsdalea populi TaxID=1172565 RepID=A0A3N0UX08_9GAMM|nr:serine kinase [Lonsdalea populi]RAT18135.1 serine kinase [Lonsdalea quercina]RAT31002.1 serine kinase [Lonsdalea populi]RAT40050.1 serine kinase [Lonsdalea populi]RAT44003.1 serine kinase [Lonsdalea populi]